MKRQWQLLVVDDEKVMRESMAAWLMEDGYAVDVAASGDEALRMAREKEYAICFVDLKMPPGIDGIETMLELRKIQEETSIVIITAYATVDTALLAMKEGAHEYIVKPCNPQEISLIVERLIKVKNLQRENLLLRRRLTKTYSFHDILSKDPKMREVFTLVRDVASLRSTVLILGESGTGKEMIARALHQAGDRASRPFVAVSCGALADTLLESELFGHERGAFTGATQQRKGKFELADGGTLFLDEIGDIAPKLQVELLRVLQSRSFFRVGGSEEVQVDVRVIAATNRNLHEAVERGVFREDLYYRLNVINIRIPPLRERLEDVPLLARHFLERTSSEQRKDVDDISEGALRRLMSHEWPGNVRELENAIERAVVTCRERVLGAVDFAFLDREGRTSGWMPPSGMTLQQIEKLAIEATLSRTAGNIKEAASVLGIDRSTLYDKLKRYGIERPNGERG